MSVIIRQEFHNTTSGHRKKYIITLEAVSGTYAVVRSWGKISAPPSSMPSKRSSFGSYRMAYDDFVAEKRKRVDRGYYEVSYDEFLYGAPEEDYGDFADDIAEIAAVGR